MKKFLILIFAFGLMTQCYSSSHKENNKQFNHRPVAHHDPNPTLGDSVVAANQNYINNRRPVALQPPPEKPLYPTLGDSMVAGNQNYLHYQQNQQRQGKVYKRDLDERIHNRPSHGKHSLHENVVSSPSSNVGESVVHSPSYDERPIKENRYQRDLDERIHNRPSHGKHSLNEHVVNSPSSNVGSSIVHSPSYDERPIKDTRYQRDLDERIHNRPSHGKHSLHEHVVSYPSYPHSNVGESIVHSPSYEERTIQDRRYSQPHQRYARHSNNELDERIHNRPSSGKHSLHEHIEHWPSSNVGESIVHSPSYEERKIHERKHNLDSNIYEERPIKPYKS